MVYDPHEAEIVNKQIELRQKIRLLKEIVTDLEKQLENQELRLKVHRNKRQKGRIKF